MAGALTPLVMLPRFTTYAGADTFVTMPIEVSAYESVILNVWRAPMCGTGSPTFALTAEESTDQVSWSAITGISAVSPTADVETQYTGSFKKRWMRVSVTLTGTSPVETCWALGFLVQRQP